MNYTKVISDKVTNLSASRVRAVVPASCTKLFLISKNWDITSDDPVNRTEYWEDPNGTMTKSQVIAEVYGSVGRLVGSGQDILDQSTTIEFSSYTCDKLELVFNNLSQSVQVVQVLNSSNDLVAEEINLAVGQIVRIQIPKPYTRYKVQVPGQVFVKINQYTV